MGINNTTKSKEYEDYISQLRMFRSDYNQEFSSEITIYIKEDSMDPDELIIVKEQMFDGEDNVEYRQKKQKIELRKVRPNCRNSTSWAFPRCSSSRPKPSCSTVWRSPT